MKLALRVGFLAIGLLLLAVVLYNTDLGELGRQVVQVGWLGLLVVLVVYFFAFLADSLSWQLTLPSMPMSAKWIRRVFVVRAIGEAFNNITPFAGMGGEPVKAVLLKKYYAVDYREAAASILLARTTNLLALLPFLAIGFWLLLGDSRISTAVELIASAGLAALVVGVVLFYLVQRLRISSLTGTRLSRWRIGARLESVLHHIRDFDERLASFYTRDRPRFAAALALAGVNWVLGALELYVVMWFLNYPISFWDAWIIETIAQLVRAGTFFIPLSIGAQEGAFMIIVAGLTGSPVAGLALALIRRVRELAWIVLGLGLGSCFKPGTEQHDASEPAGR